MSELTIDEALKSVKTRKEVVELCAIHAMKQSRFTGYDVGAPLKMSKQAWIELLTKHGLPALSSASPSSPQEDVKNQSASLEGPARSKLVFFIRHGQGIHNVAEATFGTALWEAELALDDKYTDPGLTDEGRAQATRLREVLQPALEQGQVPAPQVCITSPFLRCVETMDQCLPASVCPQVPRIVAELLREQNGRHTCDRRQPLQNVMKQYPYLDLTRFYGSLSGNELQSLLDAPDPTWTSEREAIGELNARAHKFLEWMWMQEEQVVYLSGHSGITGACYSNLTGYRHLANCEMTCVLMTEKPTLESDVKLAM